METPQGRSGMALEDLVREEVMELIDLFKEKVGANGTKLCINGMFNPFINNIIWRMVTGDRVAIK